MKFLLSSILCLLTISGFGAATNINGYTPNIGLRAVTAPMPPVTYNGFFTNAIKSIAGTNSAIFLVNPITTNGPIEMTNVVVGIVGASGIVPGPFDTNTPSTTTNIVQNLIGASTNAGFNQQWATNEWPQEGATWNWMAEPVPQLAWTTFFEATNGGLAPTELIVTNAIALYASSNLIGAGAIWFDIDEGWAWTNRDGNGNLTWNTNYFPGGMYSVCSNAHAVGAKIMVWLTSGESAGVGGVGSGYASGLTNLIRDVQTVASWGVDGVFLDEIGHSPSDAGNGAYALFRGQKMRNFFQGINSLRYNFTNAVYNAINWRTGYVNMVKRNTPFRAMSDSIPGWNYEYLLNDFFVPNVGSVNLIAGTYDTIPNSRGANTNLVSIVDTVSNMVGHISPGHYPIVGSIGWGAASDAQFTTNFLTVAAMQTFTYFMDKSDPSAMRLNLMTNTMVRSIAMDPLCKSSVVVTNFTSGETVLNAWVKPLTTGWALWLWNRSTNTATTANVNLRQAFGRDGDCVAVDAWSGFPLASTNGVFTCVCAAFEMRLFYVQNIAPSPNVVGATSLAVSNGSLVNGLVIQWEFDDGSGTTATDSSGGSKSGTLSTSTLWSGTGKTTNGLYINNNGYVSRNNSSEFDTLSKFSQSIWFKITNAPSNGFLFSKDDGSGHAGGWAVYLPDATHIQAYGSSGNFIASGSGVVVPSLTDGVWHQVVYTWDGVNQRLYLDGQLYAFKPMTGQFASFNQALNVGARNNGSGFVGQLDNFKLFNTCLQPYQVTQLYALERGGTSFSSYQKGVLEAVGTDGSVVTALAFSDSGGLYARSQNTAMFTPVQTNFISGTIYSNFYGAPIEVSTTAVLTVTTVAGDATLEARAIGSATNKYTIQTIVGTLGTTNGNYLAVVVPINGTYTFTNTSAGSGDSATCLGGQILVY